MAEKYKTFLPYRQVILCNLVLVVVPILIIISRFWAQMSNQLRREVLAMRAANQEQIQESVDFMLKNFESMAAYASLDGDLRPYELRRNNYATVTALKHLKQHASALSEMQILFHISSDSHFYWRRDGLTLPPSSGCIASRATGRRRPFTNGSPSPAVSRSRPRAAR